MFENMGFGGMNGPNNPNGNKVGTDELAGKAFAVIAGMCIFALCALVLVVLFKVIPPLADLFAEWILSFFRGIRYGGEDDIINLVIVLIFIVGIARLLSNHFRH